jgi:cholesterol oxidase
MDADAIVVGSGFGGAVTAARLADAGYRVVVLERGRRWGVKDFPRKPDDPWIFDQEQPLQRNGWFDVRVFPHMVVVAGAGVGGGSLVYANISVNAKDDSFAKGWPPEITPTELAPYYERVGAMLNVQKVPAAQWPERTRLLKEGADRNGWSSRFQRLDLAVTFDPEWNYGLPDPHGLQHSKSFVNAQGIEQGTCVHLGNCDIGCEARARNTLDFNYLPMAERHGAEIRPLHLARSIGEEPGGGYRVAFDQITGTGLTSGSLTGRLVIVAAGSIGSTELLLRSRDVARTLPKLSPFLGRNWSSNGDFLTPAIHPFRPVRPTRGPTITAAIDFLHGDGVRPEFFIEDGGFPDLARALFERLANDQSADPREQALSQTIRLATQFNLVDNIMPWFAQGRDAANGILSIRNGRLFLDWDVQRSAATIDAVVRTHEQLARSTGGAALVPFTWTLSHDLITPHPLGGANMGRSAADGVVNHAGEVFGYRNLYVADGAIVPEALGLNPSKTIAALAERIAALIVQEGR